MTDIADDEILKLAEEIQRKRQKDENDIKDQEMRDWFKSMLGRYFKEPHSGADDRAFKVIYVRDIDWCNYLKTDEISFSHIGYFRFGTGSIGYQDKWKFNTRENGGFVKEITEQEYLQYINKFLDILGWKKKMESTSDH